MAEQGSWRSGTGVPSSPAGSSSWGRGGGSLGSAKKGRGGRSGLGGNANPNKRAKPSAAPAKVLPTHPLPMNTLDSLKAQYAGVLGSGRIKPAWVDNPKSPLHNYVSVRTGGSNPKYESEEGIIEGRRDKTFRVNVVADEEYSIVGYGDHRTVREAEKTAALHALLLLGEQNLLATKPTPSNATKAANAGNAPAGPPPAQLSDGSPITPERAREFMDFYCNRFRFGKPDITLEPDVKTKGRKQVASGWTAGMVVNGSQIGIGTGTSKKAAQTNCYVDAVRYLEQCDPELWRHFDATHKPGAPVGMAPHVEFHMSEELNDDVQDIYEMTRASKMFAKRPRQAGAPQPGEGAETATQTPKKRVAKYGTAEMPSDEFFEKKSARLLEDLNAYQTDDRVKSMREQRRSLPVTQKAGDVLVKIELNQVTICMAATGSGKTTQIPQLLFDDYILRGEGARCNIICTQPRRIAAISVADRVAKERGERIGQTVGYQVRFENKLPQPHGSITFCTTGVFLRRLQSALDDTDSSNTFLDNITHVVVDEVHERDIETDLLLVVIKRLLAERKRLGKREIKLVLMSATIDPALFQNYFPEPPPSNRLAPVVEVPGRSFPVDKRYLDDVMPELERLRLAPAQGGWVWSEKNVRDYLDRELNQSGGAIAKRVANGAGGEELVDAVDDLELPYPLVSLLIAYILTKSDDGHILVFMPGWEEIKAVNAILSDTRQRPLLGLDFNDSSKYEIHILHSSIPVADQQAVFDPPREGVRRIILATNIAETSITIPDVVYVVDTGRVKEKRYDPERHLSSLVSAWVGTSNLNQRAGRAGRHRPGEYYGILSKSRYSKLNVHQMVEMKRVDLSNVVMHIKALDIPGMEVEDVLGAAIEPPAPERVLAAMEKLRMVGALDANKSLTSLGRVLLQLPVDATIGKMCLYGAFFRCLDQALTLAAVLTNRDPFMAPLHLKREANAVKDSWSPPDFRSDALGTLRAYQRWWEMQGRGDYGPANRFCSDNFLSKPTLLQIQQVKEHLFQSMVKAGVTEVVLGSAATRGQSSRGPPFGPAARFRRGSDETSPEFNTNADCMPLLAALIAVAHAPNFAIRASEKTYRTSQDKTCFIHPSSVCHLKHQKNADFSNGMHPGERELFAFGEKVRNTSMLTSGGGGNAQTYLRTCTRLDPLTYMLFGAYNVRVTARGVECDDWLPVSGNVSALDDIERLKVIMGVCMLRVFEGIGKRPQKNRPPYMAERGTAAGRMRSTWDDVDAADEEDAEEDFGDRTDLALSPQEIDEFERLTQGIVHVLDGYAQERQWSSTSRASTRPATPNGPGSGYASPYPGVGRSLPGPGPGPGGPGPGPGPGGRFPGLAPSGSGPPSAYNSRPATPASGPWRR